VKVLSAVVLNCAEKLSASVFVSSHQNSTCFGFCARDQF
jgi:hypothetical protein